MIESASTFLDIFGAQSYLVRDSLVLVLVALGVHLLLSAGIFAVPQVGLMAIGGYTAAILSVEHSMPMAVSIIGGATAATAVGALLGVAFARLDGIHLAIASIAFGEITRVIVRNLDITGKAAGIAGIPRSLVDWHIVLVLGLASFLLWRMHRSRIGLSLEALRHDPLTAAHQGINVRRYRVALFAATGTLSGLGGAFSAHLTGFLEPNQFAFSTLVDVLAATVLGGMTTVVGPFLGGIVIFGSPAVLTSLGEYREVFSGLVIILVIGIAPQGVAGLLSRLARPFLARLRKADHEKAPRALSAEHGTRVRPLPSGGTAVGSNILEVEALTRSFGGVKALQGIDLKVRAGEILGVIGPNGSGKTTLLNVLSGVYKPERGSLIFEDEDLGSLAGRPDLIRRRGIARTFQAIRLIPGRTVHDNVVFGGNELSKSSWLGAILRSRTARRDSSVLDASAADLLVELDLDEHSDQEVTSLPYGPQRRVEIARALLASPRILLLDEPTAGMTTVERSDVFDMIEKVRERGTTVVIVEHDVSSLARVCDRLAVLNFGKVLVVGEPSAVLERQEVIDAYIG